MLSQESLLSDEGSVDALSSSLHIVINRYDVM